MLERFEKINKVGLFENYTHVPECNFGEVTLVYGDNGVGKSTLAAVLDSLREKNAGELIRRRSLPGDVAPTVVVKLNGKNYSFDGHDWNDQPPYDTLDIFYPGFVTRNVHAATGVDPEHRRNLCEFVLGRKAVEKVTKLTLVDSEARTALTEKKAIEKKLELLIKKPDTLETFLGFPNDPDIDHAIHKVRTELKEAQSREVILARVVPKEISLPLVDRNKIIQFLEKNTGDIEKDVAAAVNAHIKKHLDDKGEAWLAYGAKHLDNNSKCPFCSQETATSELVTAIRSYFSAEYTTFIESLLLEIQLLRDKLGSARFAHIRTEVAIQLNAAAQWMDIMPIDQSALAATLDDPVNSLGNSRRTLIKGVICDLRVRGAQVIVLTHDERLAAMMYRDKMSKNIVALQVERTRMGSQLKPWDVERATQSEYVEHYLALDEYLNNGGDHKKTAGCIRPYLEQRLRHLFPGPPFHTRDNLGQMIGKIRASAPGERLHVLLPKLRDLDAINDAALPSHHATDDVPGLQPLTPDAVRIFAQKALAVLG